jgi:hypothetical protein
VISVLISLPETFVHRMSAALKLTGWRRKLQASKGPASC